MERLGEPVFQIGRMSLSNFLAPRRTLSSGTIRERIEPASVYEPLAQKSAPHPQSAADFPQSAADFPHCVREVPLSEGAYHACPSNFKNF